MSNWNIEKLDTVIDFNPRESIAKNSVAKKIAMDKLQPFSKFIYEYEETEFKGGTKFRNGDTLVARITPCLENGKTSQVTILDDEEVGFGSTEYIVLREKEGVTDKDYIFYLSVSPQFRSIAIQSMVGSSGRQRVQTDVLKNHEISLPPLPTQRRIAAILSSLDDKIENNRRTCEKLEEMAQAIFKQWFVAERTEEWEENELAKIANIIMGQSPPSSTYNYNEEGLPFFQGSKEFGRRKPVVEKWCNEPKRIAEQGSILISVRAPVGDMNIAVEQCCIGRGLASVQGDSVPTSVLYYAIKNSIKTIQNMSSGGSVFDSLNKKTLAEVKIAIPPNELKERYYSVFDSMFEHINLLDDEIIKLQQTRDALLPKLMSGEIDLEVDNV